MKPLLLLLLIWLAMPAAAQTVRVQGGEHEGFTRIAMVFPRGADWRFGRSDDGYALFWPEPGTIFDVSRSFDLIGRQRLRAIWTDPETGWLRLGIACACHAIAFEASANTVVIDIRDGAPSAESDFERSLQTGARLPPLGVLPAPRPKARPDSDARYDWLSTLPAPREEPVASASVGPKAPMTPGPAPFLPRGDLFDLRKRLTEQLARKASAGIVQITPMARDGKDAALAAGPDDARLPAGMAVEASSPGGAGIDGAACPQLAEVDLRAWAGEGDPFATLAAARGAMLGEFDKPDAMAITAAIKRHLHYGFGAEARNLLQQFSVPVEGSGNLLALSYLVEGDRPVPDPFAGMQSCDSPAALWSLLSAEDGPRLIGLNSSAVVQAFGGLPAEMRRHLGPDVVRRLISQGDTSGAEMVRHAIGRTLPPDDPAQTLIAAESALTAGKPEAAETLLTSLPAGQRSPEAILTLAEAAYVQRKPMDSKDLLMLESLVFEAGDGDGSAGLVQALARMRALAADYPGAFAAAGQDAALQAEIWGLLAEVGPDGALLHHAALPPAEEIKRLPEPLRGRMADRLLALGVPDLAKDWSLGVSTGPEFALRLDLARNDAEALRAAIASPDSSLALLAQDPALAAEVLTAAGAFDQLADLFARSGDTGQADRARRWAGTWDGAQFEGTDVWTALARASAPVESLGDTGPLQRAQLLLDAAGQTTGQIDELLAQTRIDG
jgi:hypothetical protein